MLLCVIITNEISAQGVTKNGESTIYSPTFVNWNGGIGSTLMLDKNGKRYGINLVVNGDFASTTTDFSTDYTKSGDLSPEGTYAIVAIPHTVHTGYDYCPDHSVPGNNQMVVNGAKVTGKVVWAETITVVQNTNYRFTYWVQTVATGNPASYAQLQLAINVTDKSGLCSAPATITCSSWVQYIYTWNSGSATSAILSLTDQNIVAQGNDFALDDIVFQQVY